MAFSWNQLKPDATTINILLAAILAIATCGQLYVLYRQERVLDRQDAEQARATFNKAMDSVEANLEHCSGSIPTFAAHVPLAQAIEAEQVAASLLTATEYNRLTILGSSELDLTQLEEYANKAEKKSKTKVDHFASQLVLAHIHFCKLSKGAEQTKMDAVRQEFFTAISLLMPESNIDTNRSRIGLAYALLAAHENYMDKSGESDAAMQLATPFLTTPCGVTSTLLSKIKGELKFNVKDTRPSITFLFRPVPQKELPEEVPAMDDEEPNPGHVLPASRSSARAPVRGQEENGDTSEVPGEGHHILSSPTYSPSASLEPSCTSDIAIANYTRTIEINPTEATNFYGRAFYHVEKAGCEYDLAITNYTDAIRLKPDYVDAYTGRAYAYSQKHEFDKSSKDSSEAGRLRAMSAKTVEPKGELVPLSTESLNPAPVLNLGKAKAETPAGPAPVIARPKPSSASAPSASTPAAQSQKTDDDDVFPPEPAMPLNH